MRFALLLSLLAFSLRAMEPAREVPVAQPFIIGISPFLDKSVKDEVYRSMIRLLVEDLPLKSTLAIYDAFNLKTITQVTLPNARVFNSPKTRANQFAPAVRDLKLFLATDHIRPTNAHLNFESTIQLPQFLDFLIENLKTTNVVPSVFLIGSPLYQDAKEPAFSMVDGYFPSDGHLLAARDKSVFGSTGDTNATTALTVHWVYFGDPWLNELHKEKVSRFWTLYLQGRAGTLATFSGDLPTVMRGFRAAGSPSTFRQWTLDPEQTKIEMLRVSRSVEVADWLTRDNPAGTAQTPPSVMVGPMKIGIRWKHNIDLDLYATPHRDAETLFFQHLRSPEGYYYKDHRSSPGREYEFIEFESPVDIREVEASVNFYKGDCPGGPRGEVRIEFDGRIYGATFSIPSSEGNQGRSGRSQQDFWTRIPVKEILKITAAAERAG